MTTSTERTDWAERIQRLKAWWNNEYTERPMLLITSPAARKSSAIPPVPKPPNWLTDYSIKDFPYRIWKGYADVTSRDCHGEAIPNVTPDTAPGSLALYLGCPALETGTVEKPGTIWIEPILKDIAEPCPDIAPDNPYWRFTFDCIREHQRIADGKYIISFPDMVEGLDTLAALRGSQEVLIDLYDRPDETHRMLSAITDRWLGCYDELHKQYKQTQDGTFFWAYHPGKMMKVQCDMGAMLSPEMFLEFEVPVLKRITAHGDASVFHLDGVECIRHLDHLLNISTLSMIQWQPGAGRPPVSDKSWWPMYHRILEAGKKIIAFGYKSTDAFKSEKKEFGRLFSGFMLSTNVANAQDATNLIDSAFI